MCHPRHLPLYVPLIASLLSLHCGVTHPVRTLEEGRTNVVVSLGGPVVELSGSTVPLPYTTAGIATGLSDGVTLSVAVHPTAMLFGNLGLEGGISYRVTEESGWMPEVTGKAQAVFLSNLRSIEDTRLFPSVSIVGSYRVGERSLVYGGMDQFFQWTDPVYFVTPMIGWEFPLAGRWTMQTELKWLAANVNTAHGVFEGHGSIGGYGNLGLYVGVTYGL